MTQACYSAVVCLMTQACDGGVVYSRLRVLQEVWLKLRLHSLHKSASREPSMSWWGGVSVSIA